MIDDNKYSVGRIVLYKHPNPTESVRSYGKFGPDRTVGVVTSVELVTDVGWLYTIENVRTDEVAKVPESDVFFALFGREPGKKREAKPDQEQAEQIVEELVRAVEERPATGYMSVAISELVRREESEERTMRHGRDLPLEPGDYIRIRGDLRSEMEPHHNHYAKIIEVSDSDISAIESTKGVYKTKQKLRVLLDDGIECEIYDPEVRIFYTSEGRSMIFNWRAATFLAESFHDEPPYRSDFGYLVDHLFTRAELDEKNQQELGDLYVQILYVKGRIGLRDIEVATRHVHGVPKSHLEDAILAISRFDMTKNRTMTPEEIAAKRSESNRLRDILDGE